MLIPIAGFGQLNNQQIRNLVAFSKVYGYVQYFHPSDQNKIQIWDGVAIEGCKTMLGVNDDDQLIRELRRIFLPIAPSIKISRTSQKEAFDPESLKPGNLEGYKEISWQHLGFNLYSGISNRPYKSIRLNRPPEVGNDRNFDMPLTGQYDVSGYHGLKYDFSFTTAVNNPSINSGRLKIVNGKDTVDVISSPDSSRHHFTGTIAGSDNRISFSVLCDPNLPISIENPIFKIVDGKKSYVLQQIASPFQKPGGNAKRVSFEILNLDYSLYRERLKFGDYLDKEIVDGINVTMPLVLLGNSSSTYPLPKPIDADRIIKNNKLENRDYYQLSSFGFIELRLADIIMLWNILQHSFPYMDDVKINRELLLRDMLKEASIASSHLSYQNVIEKMCSFYNDAHMFVSINGTDPAFTVPISLTKINNKVVVKDVFPKKLNDVISPGDVIVKIDNIPIRKKIDSILPFLSGSKQKKDLLLVNRLLEGKKGTIVTITVRKNNVLHKVIADRANAFEAYIPGNAGYLKRGNGWINPDVYYFDLTRNSLSQENFDVLKTAKSIIFDLRGYVFNQTISVDLVPALIMDTLKAVRIFNPKILYPDLKNLTYHSDYDTYVPNLKNRITAQVVFLTDASAISASESLLGLIKDFHLGTIIGQPTAGTTGDVNIAYLPGNLIVYFSGMLVKNSDGSKHHLKGIVPDVYATQTQKSIAQREDLVLNTAIKFIRRKNKGSI